MTLLGLELFYALAGGMLVILSAQVLRERGRPRRIGTALFWALLAACFLLGRVLPSVVVGYLVLAMVLLAALKQVVPFAERDEGPSRAARIEEAARLGNRLFWPALALPATAVLGSVALGRIRVGGVRLVDPGQATLVALALGAVLALVLALALTRAPARAPAERGGRLIQAIGWSLLLPQSLAALGGIFAKAGIGALVAELVGRALPTSHPLLAVVAYCLGMLLFTLCLGNAFAAFAVVTGGIGVPLIVQQHGGNPAIMAAIGMLAGYSGTLMTPMAANFNLVPAMLLELEDERAVIKAQLPVGLALFAWNVALMALCVYRF